MGSPLSVGGLKIRPYASRNAPIPHAESMIAAHGGDL
jgi:hypothetical protein